MIVNPELYFCRSRPTWVSDHHRVDRSTDRSTIPQHTERKGRGTDKNAAGNRGGEVPSASIMALCDLHASEQFNYAHALGSLRLGDALISLVPPAFSCPFCNKCCGDEALWYLELPRYVQN